MTGPAAWGESLAPSHGGERLRAKRVSTLVNRNVFVGRRRTSLRLEPAMWDALAEICRREDLTLHDLCGLIDERRRASSLTAAIRVFIVNYFRSAATEEGHANTGHGMLYRMHRGVRSAGPAAGTPTSRHVEAVSARPRKG